MPRTARLPTFRATANPTPRHGDSIISLRFIPLRLVVVLLGIVAIHGPAGAQNAEDAKTPRRWKASAELGYTDQSGNRSLRLLTGGFKASHLRKDQFRLDLSLQSRYGEGDNVVVARNHFGSLAFDLRPEDTLSPFLYVDAEHDRFKRIDLRASGGAGAKYTPYRQKGNGNEVSVSLALLLSHESLIATERDPFPNNRTISRTSLRVRGSQDLKTGLRLQHTSFYQPNVEQVADYLLRSETGARMAITSRLAFSVNYQYNRTALPPQGVSPDDRVIRTGITVDF